MFANVTNAGLHAATFVTAVCPQAPPGAQEPVDDILSYVLWGMRILFFVGVIIGVGSIVAGRMFGMPHASAGGIIGLVIVFCAVIAYLILPGVLDLMMGSGCV